jgi:hypothetical protein
MPPKEKDSDESQSFVVVNNSCTLGVSTRQDVAREQCAGKYRALSLRVSSLHFASFSTTGNDRVGRRISRFVRGWIFAGALAQAVLPGVIGVVDASAAGDAVTAAVRPHIEAHGTPQCPRVHQEDNCALCQFVAGALATATGQPSPAPQHTKLLQIVRRVPLFPEWLTDGAPSLPRAPPAQA